MSNYPSDSRPSNARAAWLTLSQLLVLVLLIIVLVQNWRAGAYRPRELPPPDPVKAAGNLAEDEKATIQLFKQSGQSVVHITTSALARDNFSLNVMEIPRGTGTGFIWDGDGHVVTNFHVVEEGNRWNVTLADQSTWDAELVGVAPDRDVAVLKIDADKDRLRPLLIGSSTGLEVGQKVFAIGNPFGLDQTLTTGIISGVGREIRSRTNRLIEGVIQTDAAINPGNSGGPLLNSSGELIGVNTAIYSPSGASAGIGFAIPVDAVKRAVPQLIANGKVVRPGLGVRVASEQITERLGLEGVLVVSVVDGGPAEKAGLKPTTRTRDGDILLGDVIQEVDGKEVKNSDQFFNRLESHNVGDEVTLTVLRGAKTDRAKKVEVKAKLVAVE